MKIHEYQAKAILARNVRHDSAPENCVHGAEAPVKRSNVGQDGLC